MGGRAVSASNDQIYAALMDLKQDVGGLKQAIADNRSYTSAVGAKLDAHVKDQDAHGVGGRRRTWGDFLSWAAVLIAGLEVALGIKTRSGH